MNQTLNGKIKPLKVLKTTQFQGAPLCRPRSPSRAGTRRDFKPNWDFFGGPPPPYLLAASLSEGKFHPASRGLGCQVGKKNPICFQSGSSLPSTQPFSSPRSPAPSPQCWRVRQAGLSDAFFFLLVFIFSSKNVCGLFCPPQPPFSQAHAPAQPSLPGPAKNLSVLGPATAAGSENSQMTEDFQP